MKVLHIINSLAGGGAEKLMSELLPVLNKKVDCLELLVLTRHNDIYGRELKEKGIIVHYLSESEKIFNYNILKKLKQFDYSKFDLIHGHLFPVQYYLPFISNCKTVFTEHSTTNRRRNAFFRPIEKFIWKRTDFVTFVSHSALNEFEGFLQIKDNKNVVIYNGIDINLINKFESISLRKLLNLKEGDLVIVMTSSFKPEKDYATLLKAVQYDDTIHLVLIGDGQNHNNVKDFSNELDINNRVHFMGYRKNAVSYMKGADIVVQSSIKEGFGIAVLEAMACHKPVLVSDLDGLREVVDNELYRFEVENHKQLKDKIDFLRISTNYSEAVAYSRNRITNFSIESSANKYLNLYERILKCI